MKYFLTLPDIFYNKTLAKNLLTRAASQGTYTSTSVQYQPYVSEFGERIENISYSYYGTCDQYWMIAMANQVIDPYYDMSLGEDSFRKFIDKKYGSFELAYKNILFYRNNWAIVDQTITSSGYAALPENHKKYWNPITTNEVNVIGYERKKEDTTINTNMIIVLSGTFDEDVPVEEKAVRVQSNVEVGRGTVSFCNTSTLILKHITGTFEPTNETPFAVTFEISGKGGTVTSQDMIQHTIPEDELVYFTAVTAVDYENEKNVQKTNLNLFGKQYAEIIENSITSLFPESQ